MDSHSSLSQLSPKPATAAISRPAVEAKGLVKTYPGGVQALKGVNISVRQGSVESRYVVPGAYFQSLRKSYLVAASCFLGQPAGSESPLTIAPQRLTKTDLMGELGHVLAFAAYQLTLPFPHESCRQLEYTRVLAGTTF